MMNKILLFLVTIFSFFIFTISVSAAAQVTASVTGVNVSVNISGAGAGSEVTIVISAPNDSLPTGPVLQIANVQASGSGSASFSFELPEIAPTGVYTIKISNLNLSSETTFSFTNNLLITELNKTTDTNEIRRLIEEYGETADLNMTDYFILPPNAQAKIIEAVKKEKGSGSITEARLMEVFNLSLAIASVASSDSNESGDLSIVTILRKHGSVLGINFDSGDYMLLSAEAKTNFRALFSNNDYVTAENMRNEFSDNILIAYFRNSSWPTIQSYIDLSAKTRLSLDLGSKYQALNDKSLPFKAVVTVKNTISSVADVNRIFNDAVNTAYNAQQGGSIVISGTGGGGGGSSVSMGREFTDIGKPEPIITTEDVNFSDLFEAEWAIEYIERLYELEIVNGVGDNKFSPNAPVTREQFLKMILLAFGYEVKEGKTSFSDAAEDSWYAPYVFTALDAGIVNGISETEFGTGMEISRQDMVVMLNRILEAKGTELEKADNGSFYDDNEIADYAKDAVYKMTTNSIVSGIGDNIFSPLTSATRAAAAKVISLSMDMLQ